MVNGRAGMAKDFFSKFLPLQAVHAGY